LSLERSDSVYGHPEATLRLSGSQPVGTPRLPGGYPEATPRLPRSYLRPRKKAVDLQPLTAIQQNNFTPQPAPCRAPITLTVCVTICPSTTSRQHYFHRTAPLYMRGAIIFRSLAGELVTGDGHFGMGREFAECRHLRFEPRNRRGRTSNSQHPTSNNQCLPCQSRDQWMLGVGCWLLDVPRFHGEATMRPQPNGRNLPAGASSRMDWRVVA
jgi:hypothetical protein